MSEIFFSDYFKVDEITIEKYGAFDVSLICDLPLFIDPFLLFNSNKVKYKELHDEIIEYLRFLRDKSLEQYIDKGLLKAWFTFPEVKQNWFGFTFMGNKGSGLGTDFAKSLNNNLNTIFSRFGNEQITKGSHLEKLCLIKSGIGKDKISDFTANLIKSYLLEYTQEFAQKYIDKCYRRIRRVGKVNFNYETESWQEQEFELPYCEYNNDYVLLTPIDILTKDDTWINHTDFIRQFELIPSVIDNQELRSALNNYFSKQLRMLPSKKGKITKEERENAIYSTIKEFPEIIDYFIKFKEDRGDEATRISKKRVLSCRTLYVKNVYKFNKYLLTTDFYKFLETDSFREAGRKLNILKDFIEKDQGYKLFYDNEGNNIKGEKDLQRLFKLACRESTAFDISKEASMGGGSVDFSVSMGSKDKTIIEFKLAGNMKLKNIKKQVDIYKSAEKIKGAFFVILFFNEEEFQRASKILSQLGISDSDAIMFIDANKDNKPYPSQV